MLTYRFTIVSLLVAVCFLCAAVQQKRTAADDGNQPTLVKALNLTTQGSRPSDLTVIDGVGYFSAETRAGSQHAWRTDGTADGTYQLTPNASNDVYSHGQFTAFKEHVYFIHNERDLWRSDGTAAGAEKLIDLLPDRWDYVNHLTVIGDALYFMTTNYGEPAIWRTDGTAAGTEIVFEYETNAAGSLHGYQDKLIFTIPTAGSYNLYSYDTASGNVQELQRFATMDSSFVSFDNQLYFSALEQDRWEIWRTDGTAAGTERVALAFFGFEGATPQLLTAHNGALYFYSVAALGQQLYRLQDDTISLVPNSYLDTYSDILSFAGDLYTVGLDSQQWALYRVGDSGLENVTAAQELNLTVRRSKAVVATDDYIYFQAAVGVSLDDNDDAELWRFDGSDSELAAEVHPRAGSYPALLTPLGGGLIFSANDGVHGRELWYFDVTTAALTLDINTQLSGAFPHNFVHFADGLAFAVSINDYEYGVWWTDGSAENTRPLSQPFDQPRPHDLTPFDGSVYFARGKSLWRTDASGSNTIEIQVFDDHVNTLLVVGETLFIVTISETASLLWKTDGTSVTKVEATGGNVSHLVNGNGLLYFSSHDERVSAQTLWRSDGTEAGTYSLHNTGSNAAVGENPADLTFLNGKLYFNATGPTGRELWISDGTPAGTRLLKDINTLSTTDSVNGSTPREFTLLNDKVYFSATSPEYGRELWVTDGTTEGTQLHLNFVPGPTSGFPNSLTAFQGALYFIASDSRNLPNLWRTDDDQWIPQQVTTLPDGLFPMHGFTPVNEWLYFSQYDQTYGYELWRTNGSDTMRISDINQHGNSHPAQLTQLNDLLIFQADPTSSGGSQLYRLQLDSLPSEKMFLPRMSNR